MNASGSSSGRQGENAVLEGVRMRGEVGVGQIETGQGLDNGPSIS